MNRSFLDPGFSLSISIDKPIGKTSEANFELVLYLVIGVNFYTNQLD